MTDYIHTDHWWKVRNEALARALGRCQVCNSPDYLEVHHRTYDGYGGQEWPEDLTVLCCDCHDLFHKAGRLAS